MRLKAAVVLLLLTGGSPLSAQMRFDENESRTQNLPVFYEAIALFSADSSKQLVSVHYRIGQNFFIFVRNEGATNGPEYVGNGELVVELQNEQKVSVAHEIRQLSLTRATLPKEGEHPPAIQGVFSFRVPPGNYTLIFNLDDHESGRSFIEKTKKVKVPDSRAAGLTVSDLMLVQTSGVTEMPAMFIPTNRSENSLFGESGGVVTEALLPKNTDTLSLHWRLHGVLDGFGERVQRFSDSTYFSKDGLLAVAPKDSGVSYEVKPSAESWRTVYIPMPLQKLEPGIFTLDIDYRSGGLKRIQQQQFRVTWPARPFSLMDQDLAIDALRYIAKDSEMEELLSGGTTKRAEAFARFWRERSRDTTTAYNEVMAEFYYRVDDALRRFSTARENDGYKTDRGRIYILYGPPQKSERTLQPDSAPTETWTYARLHRKFIFIDTEKNGNYILSQSENL